MKCTECGIEKDKMMYMLKELRSNTAYLDNGLLFRCVLRKVKRNEVIVNNREVDERMDKTRKSIGGQEKRHPEMGRVTHGRLPDVYLSKVRKLCACCMKRKTYWIFDYGKPWSKFRICSKCMVDEQRQAIADGY